MLQDKVVWITGSSSGIGRATAITLAKEGYKVAVHYNRSEDEARQIVEEIESSESEALLVGGDVSDAGEVNRMAGEIDDHFGRLDILVNNAGALIKRSRLEEITEDLWDSVMSVNLKSVYLCSRAVLPFMKRQGGGKIVNVTSIAARTGGGPGSIAYAASKGGVSTLTRGMAKELISDGIVVNAVAPGFITTPFHDQFTPDDVREQITGSIPAGREGTPEEIASAIAYLVSPQADYLVGEIIEINGGRLMN